MILVGAVSVNVLLRVGLKHKRATKQSGYLGVRPELVVTNSRDWLLCHSLQKQIKVVTAIGGGACTRNEGNGDGAVVVGRSERAIGGRSGRRGGGGGSLDFNA